MSDIIWSDKIENGGITSAGRLTAADANQIKIAVNSKADITTTNTALNLKLTKNTLIIGATKTKITYDVNGLIVSATDATTSDIADSLNKRYVIDSDIIKLSNISGTNTGDNAINSLYSGLATSKQDTLISATNIKTINGASILGAGDLVIFSGGLTSFNGRTAAAAVFQATDIPVTTVTPGNYTNATVNIGADGRVISAASGTSYTPRGQLFTVSGSQWGTSAVGSNFIASGGGPTYTFNANNLTVSGGTGVNNFIAYNYFSFLNDWTATLSYVPTLNTAGLAMSWGRYASGAGATNYTFWLDNTVSSASVLKVLVSGSEFPVVFNDNKINVPNGATVTINVTECKNKFIFSVEVNNAGVKSEQLVEYEKPFYSGGANSSRSSWGIIPVGGTSVISSFSCYSRTLVGVDLAIVGDSYLEGLLSLNEETTLGGILEKRTFSRVLTYAKGGATTQDLVDCQAELLSLLPKNVYLNISANQIAGSPTITFNLMKSVADALTAQGCNVYVGKAYVRGNVTISDLMIFNNLIDTNYPSERVVDCYTPFLNAAGTSFNPQYKDIAGTHFNLEGNRLYADICWSKFKTFLAPSNNYEPEQTYFNKYLSKNTLISYPTFVNSKVPPVAVLLTAATSSQTTLSINFSGSLTFAGYDKGYAKINNGEIVLITGVDDINNRLFVTRGQLGTTPTAAAIGAQVSMFTYVLATPNGPQHLIDNGGYHIIKGVDVFVTSVSTIYAAGTNNILSLVNNNAGNGGGESNLQISRLSSAGASRIRLMTGTTTNYEIALNTSNDFQINRPGQNDFYMSAGNLAIGKTSPVAKLDLNGSFASKTLRSSTITLTLDSIARSYFFGGTTAATWTLPLITTSINVEYYIKNTGTANITLVTQGADLMFGTSTISSLVIPVGTSYILQNDGLYWEIM